MNYKKDFPIFKRQKSLVYLDSAATSQKPEIVINSISDFYKNYNANVRRGLYPLSERVTEKVEDVRKKVAKFLNAKSADEIIFVRNATEALNLIAYSLSSHIKSNDTISTTIIEHHSNFVPWQILAAKTGANFQVLDFDENFQLSRDFRNSKIIAINHVSNVLGSIQKKTKSKGITVLDAAQSTPHMTIDVQKLGCDFLVFSGHKMFAATGIGVLYGKKKLLSNMEPFLYGGEMIREVSKEQTTFEDLPHKFEAGTPDIAGIISLGAAIDYLTNIGMIRIQQYEQQLIQYATERLRTMEGLTIYGPQDLKDRSSVIAFNIHGVHAHDIAQILGDMNVCIRAGHHCTMPLHKKLGISASARISFSVYNDDKDIQKLLEGLKKVRKVFNS